MELLNNINVVIGVICGLITIGTTILGCVKFLQKKATFSQQKQVTHVTSSLKQPSYQVLSKSLSRWDWMEVLWNGFEDCLRAKEGSGWISSIGVGVIGTMIVSMISSSFGSTILYISLTIFFTLFISMNLLFYVYFVGRRIEKKVENITHPSSQKSKGI